MLKDFKNKLMFSTEMIIANAELITPMVQNDLFHKTNGTECKLNYDDVVSKRACYYNY